MRIEEVKTRRQLKEFIQLPQRLYANQPHYISPLNMHIKSMLGKMAVPGKTLLLARDGKKVIARLAVKVHEHHQGEQHEKLLHFGFFECLENQPAAAQALVTKAHSLYPGLKMMGPYHFRMEDPYIGTLIHGFEQDPYLFMPYNPPYYDELLQNAGMKKAVDLLTYEFAVTQRPEQIKKIAGRSTSRGYSIRWLDAKKLKQEVKIIADIFNEALSENWGFEPITDDQLQEMFLLFKFFIDPRTVCFANYQGQDIGCVILLPNLNPLLKAAHGKFSLGLLLKLLQQKKKAQVVRGYALGMRKKHQGSGVVCLLIDAMYERGISLGIKKCEISWVLENNRPMAEMSKAIGGIHNKTYRVYEKKPLEA